jgi:hypothetical protein
VAVAGKTVAASRPLKTKQSKSGWRLFMMGTLKGRIVMKPFRSGWTLGLALLLAPAIGAFAQQRDPHIGFVYPAGGQVGTMQGSVLNNDTRQ